MNEESAPSPEPQKPGKVLDRNTYRRALIAADDIFHVAVAAILVIAAGVILVDTVPHLLELNTIAMISVINNCLLVLIVTEILWTIIRYLGKQEFSLNPFLFIGVIAGIRQILVLEAERSLGELETTPLYLMELGVITAMVFVLVLAYYLSSKARS